MLEQESTVFGAVAGEDAGASAVQIRARVIQPGKAWSPPHVDPMSKSAYISGRRRSRWLFSGGTVNMNRDSDNQKAKMKQLHIVTVGISLLTNYAKASKGTCRK